MGFLKWKWILVKKVARHRGDDVGYRYMRKDKFEKKTVDSVRRSINKNQPITAIKVVHIPTRTKAGWDSRFVPGKRYKYALIDGHHRLTAHQAAGRTRIRAIVVKRPPSVSGNVIRKKPKKKITLEKVWKKVK